MTLGDVLASFFPSTLNLLYHRGPGRTKTSVVTSILKLTGMDYNALKDAALACHHVTKNTQ